MQDRPESPRTEEAEEEEDFLDCQEGPQDAPPSSSSRLDPGTEDIPEGLPQTETVTETVIEAVTEIEEAETAERREDVSVLEQAFAVEKDIARALEEKEKGNEYFRLKDFDNAIQCYTLAIELCPEDSEHESQLATFYGNRSAAYAADEEFEQVVEDCTAALQLNPQYTKVLLRRMAAYEKLGKLEEALADAKKAQEIDLTIPNIQFTINRLQKLNDEKFEKMKDEALSKLKDLGNSILGNFGLSLDNFKMQQDPKTGSWSVNMGNK